MSDVSNKVFVVLGSEGLIGKIVVEDLLENKAMVVAADKNIDTARNSENLLSVQADITDETS